MGGGPPCRWRRPPAPPKRWRPLEGAPPRREEAPRWRAKAPGSGRGSPFLRGEERKGLGLFSRVAVPFRPQASGAPRSESFESPVRIRVLADPDESQGQRAPNAPPLTGVFVNTQRVGEEGWEPSPFTIDSPLPPWEEVEDLFSGMPSAALSPPPAASMPFMSGRPSAPRDEGPWNALGMAERPPWWHYWEERHAAPPPEVEELPEGEAPPPPEGGEGPPEAVFDEEEGLVAPPPDASSAEIGDYWRTRRMRRLIYEAAARGRASQSGVDASSGAPPQQFNFHAPPLVDGPWNQNSHVSRWIKEGLSFSIDENKRGKAPRRLDCSNPTEAEYIRQLVRDGILVEQEPRFSVPHFFLRRGSKLRLIFNGKRLNAAVKTPPHFSMKSHATIAALAQSSDWHASDDLSNMFFSLKLSKNMWPMFGLKTNIGNFCYTALPFGFSWAPFCAHVAVDQICQRAIERGHKVTHYLDDFHYFGSNVNEVLQAREFVRELLSQAGWVVNPKKAVEPAREFAALGVEYDLREKSSRIPPKSILELIEGIKSINEKTLSRRKIASFLGSLVFFGNAVPGSLTLCEDLIQIVSRPKFDWGARFHTSHVKSYLLKAANIFSKLGWCPIQRGGSTPVHIYTDATPNRIAYVYGDIVVGKDIKKKQIYRAEADAIHFLLSRNDLPPDFVIRTDNEALMHALKKGRSRIFEARRVCLDILRLRLKGHRINVKWIATDKNPADEPSRRAAGSA